MHSQLGTDIAHHFFIEIKIRKQAKIECILTHMYICRLSGQEAIP